MNLINKRSIILFVFFTNNNILCTITNFRGETLMWSTAGSDKVKGTKKITTSTIFTLIKKLYNFINANNFSLYIKVKGINKVKTNFIKQLKTFNFNILVIQEKLCLPHSGCKRSKVRKL